MTKSKERNPFKLLRVPLIALAISSPLLLGGCCDDCERGPRGPVGPEGPSPVIIVPDVFKNIQEAIDSVAQVGGGTVYIRAGEYTLSQGLHISSSNITVKGEQGTIIALGDHVNQPVILVGSEAEIPTVGIENIRIENLELDGNKDSQDFEEDPNRTGIRNNGIDIRMASSIWITGVDIHDARSGGLVAAWNPRYLFVDKSSFHHNFFDGIALYDGEDIQVSNFFCYENGSAGLSLDNGLENVVFSAGSILNNGTHGIFALHTTDLTFHGLLIGHNGGDGCFLSHKVAETPAGATRLFFNSCSFIDNGRHGFFLSSPASESPDNAVVGCLFSGNTGDAVKVDPNGELFQQGNVFQ